MQTNFNPAIYQGRKEPDENDLAQYYYQHIKAYHNQPLCLIGFACDQGVNRNQGRIGTKFAPDIIKNAFGKLPIPWQLQQDYSLDNLIGDFGNIVCDDNQQIIMQSLETVQAHYAHAVCQIIQNNSLPIALGGGHEIALGSFMGLYQAVHTSTPTKKRIGIINLDAHFDLRSAQYATSGTPFLQMSDFLAAQQADFCYLTIGISEFANTASLFEKAAQLGVVVVSEDDCYRVPFETIQQRVVNFIDGVDVIYLSLDLDVLSAASMPAVSAVNAKGLSLDFVENCLAMIIASGKVGMMDMAEFNPNYDIDGRGAKVAGRILALMVKHGLMATQKST